MCYMYVRWSTCIVGPIPHSYSLKQTMIYETLGIDSVWLWLQSTNIPIGWQLTAHLFNIFPSADFIM